MTASGIDGDDDGRLDLDRSVDSRVSLIWVRVDRQQNEKKRRVIPCFGGCVGIFWFVRERKGRSMLLC